MVPYGLALLVADQKASWGPPALASIAAHLSRSDVTNIDINFRVSLTREPLYTSQHACLDERFGIVSWVLRLGRTGTLPDRRGVDVSALTL